MHQCAPHHTVSGDTPRLGLGSATYDLPAVRTSSHPSLLSVRIYLPASVCGKTEAAPCRESSATTYAIVIFQSCFYQCISEPHTVRTIRMFSGTETPAEFLLWKQHLIRCYVWVLCDQPPSFCQVALFDVSAGSALWLLTFRITRSHGVRKKWDGTYGEWETMISTQPRYVHRMHTARFPLCTSEHFVWNLYHLSIEQYNLLWFTSFWLI